MNAHRRREIINSLAQNEKESLNYILSHLTDNSIKKLFKDDDFSEKFCPKKIKRNLIKCKKCGDKIESKHRHDYVTCKCAASSIDGGLDYIRVGFHEQDSVEILTEFEPGNWDDYE